MNTTLSALVATVFSFLLLFQQAIASSRPAMEEITATPSMEEMTATNDAVEEDLEKSHPDEVMSSVEMIRQQETQPAGDVLQLPPREIQPGDVIKVRQLDFPRRGMSMDKVENEFGPPVKKIASVGEPPITRWIYGDRVVYFEYSTVLHVVAR